MISIWITLAIRHLEFGIVIQTPDEFPGQINGTPR